MADDNKRKLAPMTDYKIYNDSIHGHMQFHPLLIRIIHTPQFQRLRDLKQLGLAYYVYPSASHNRFEHSLGTCYLAGLLMDALYKDRPFPKDENERFELEKDKLCVEIAALCHDLGHGPFSHLWEEFLHRTIPQENWKHEENSIKTFYLLLNEKIKVYPKKQKTDNDYARIETIRDLFGYYGLGDKEIELITTLIRGKKAVDLTEDEKKKHYLYQIVNNADNDIDVDKIDYLSRDSKMLNVNIHFQPHRIIKLCRIAEADGSQQICFRDKVCTDIADMFMARAALYDKAYYHPKVQIMTEMVLDAFCLADKDMTWFKQKFFLHSTDPTFITSLADSVFYVILNWNSENLENLAKGQELLKRFLKREYYFIIAIDVINPNKKEIKEKKIQALPLNIVSRLKKENKTAFEALTKDDIGVAIVKIKSGGSNKSEPLENVYIYGKDDSNKAEKYKKDKSVSSVMPTLESKYVKRKVFVMYKGEDQTMSENLCKRENVIKEVIEKEL